MGLTTGTRLGPYEIVSAIGAGGMGEVYRARDTRLQRNVAIKVLPETLAADQQFRERFDREARALSQLTHPHICTLHDVGEDAGRAYLVMELLEGETLADRLTKGALPLKQALDIAVQIASALDRAHRAGITHRDLKPGNIMLTKSGAKLLDFGLAKTGAPAAGAGLSMLSTTPPNLTAQGTILGTFQYMAPEQLDGQEADARTDIFAFGAVLYEMLTGKKAFEGKSQASLIGAILKDEPPPISTRQPLTPRALDRVVMKCLAKEPDERWQSAKDLHDELTWVVAEGATTSSAIRAGAGSRTTRERLAWIVAGLVAGIVGVLFAGLAFVHFREAPPEEQRLLQYSVPYPENTTLGFLEVSPDGRRLVLVSQRDGTNKMYLRSLDLPELQPLSGTDNARSPFWSPDSRFIGFVADGKLKVMPAAGGPARVLCSETGVGTGGTWSRNGVILFGSERGPLRRVDAAGGICAVVGKDEGLPRTPVFLPDGNHFFYVSATDGDDSSRGVYLAALDNPTPRKILADYSSVVYAPPIAGGRAHLLFLRETTLMAQPFDDAKLEPVGDPFPVAPRATRTFNSQQVAASVSNGLLVYLTGSSRVSQLTWFDRSGKELGKVGSRAEQTGGVPSPDGNAVLTSRTESNGQIATWLFDLARGSESRFLPSEMQPRVPPVWFPDGRRVLSVMTGPAGLGLYQVDTNEGGRAELVLSMGAGTSIVLSAFSRDGRFLIYTASDPKTQADIWYLPWDGEPDWGKAVKFLATDVIEGQGQLSPDGKWIAYTSFETGTREVSIRPFPTGSGVSKVSVDGGTEPRWSADGKQLYYLRPLTAERSVLLAAAMEFDGRGGVRTGTPQMLFEIHALRRLPQFNVFTYVPYPDGRFLVAVAEAGEPTINVITNWEKAVADKGQSEGR